jgi:uncharacterized protein (TIGR02453 family)
MGQIKQSTLDFLSELKQNNNREWFHTNRKRYDEAKTNYEEFVQDIIDEVAEFDPILKGLEVSSCTYRIYRDIRFSNDKTIYKSHMGAFIVKGGKKNGDRFAGYYIHVEPDGKSMIAGGAYMPPMPWLTTIRQKIGENGSELISIINNNEFIKYFGELEGDKLRSAPKGYSRDHPYIELLKYKSYLVSKMISDKEMTSKGCNDLLISACKAMKPLNDFLNDY